MSNIKFAAFGVLASLAALVPSVSAHGYVSGVVVDGTYYGGYDVTKYSYMANPPAVIGWSSTATDLGFDVIGDGTTDVICHRQAKNAKLSAPVAAGKQITFQWTPWPDSHHGPVITYLANCNGDCSTVDKTTLKFVKFDAVGLIDDSSPPGYWAADKLIANNNTWTVTLPTNIAPGNYVLRHEIIALHSAGSAGGAQDYPQCFNIQITGSGTASPSGVAGTSLYSANDPGILISIYNKMSSYPIPGPAIPAVWGGSGNGGSGGTSAAPVPTTTRPAGTTLTTAVRTTTTAAASPTSTGTVAKYGQCGGLTYKGPTTCVAGTTCQKQNDYYSQCL